MSSGRFTEKDENGKWRLDVSPYYPPFYETLRIVDEDSFFDYIYGPAIDRLGEYEDLNFSPDTLKAIIKEWKEWVDAKNDGRLLILPCKVGDTVFAKVEEGVMNEDKILEVHAAIYDEVETYPNCSVQILRNSATGDVSIGWWVNEEAEE